MNNEKEVISKKIISEDKLFIEKLLEKISKVPSSPGIYQYLNEQGKIIYIGKAKNLRNRVRSYFHSFQSHSPKTQALVKKIADIEIIIVSSEAEALILEDTLIKKYKPRYNIMLKDDKTYPYIKITNEPYPRVYITRSINKDGAKYLGPFTEVRAIKTMLESVKNIFQIRSCKHIINAGTIAKKNTRPCLNFHIAKCQAPCIGAISLGEYNNNIKMAHQVLLGKTKKLTKSLETKMLEHSENMEFEKAAVVRNRLQSLKKFTSKQKIVSPEHKDRDLFGIARIGDYACTLVFIVREGKLIGKRHFIVTKAELETSEEIIQKTLEKYYLETNFVPKEIVLPNELSETDYLLDWLGKKRLENWQNYYENIDENNIYYTKLDIKQAKEDIEKLTSDFILIKIPKNGILKELLDMANTNADYLLKEYISSIDKREKVIPHSVIALQRDLNLHTPPRRIECYDNSHLQGTDMVSSMVVFVDGKPKKSEYRKFRAKEDGMIIHNDDFAMMRQTIERRFKRAIEEKQTLPNLVIVDGGKGQLSSAYEILQKLGLTEKVAIIGLAKRLEEVFTPNNKYSIMLPKTSSSLKLIQQLRDEAHRFAITFNRELRSKRAIKSELSEIKGIGKITIQKLINKFGSVKGIKEANTLQLTEVLNNKQLQIIKECLLDKK
jgi:excinuclease ABC subunit C